MEYLAEIREPSGLVLKMMAFSTSPVPIALKFGLREDKEIVTVFKKKTEQIVGRVMWDAACGDYLHVWYPKYLERKEAENGN